MKYTNFISLGDALDNFFKENGLEEKILEYKAKEAWNTIVGPIFAKSTKEITVKENKMYVKIMSPIMKQELLLNKTNLLKRINTTLKKDFIRELFIN